MLDLTDSNRWEVKLPNGFILHVKMPTIKRVDEVESAIRFIATSRDVEQVNKVLYKSLVSVFNDNTDGKKFTQSKLEELIQPKHLMMILTDYMTYCMNLKKK